MKEIKYRAWLKEKEMLVEVLGISFEEKYVRLPIESEPSDEYWWYETAWGFDEVELMQFTGLEDKNGVEIYEGDILINRHEEDTGEVVFEDGSFFWETETFTQLLGEINDEIEVIGNIYENHELIKEVTE